MSNLPAIEIQNLDHSFDKTSVLEKVSFRVEQGEFVGIFGPNGGGKTTLLRLLMGFQKPSRGQIQLFGKSPENLRPKIGYVPQINRLDKLFPITVLDIVLMGCLSSANIFGSQAQRVLIARAIVAQPDLLLLDEPTASVDPEAEKDILKILEELKGKTTILMVTHDLQTIINQVGKLLCVHKQVHTLLPNQVCEHFGLGLYHRPISETTSIGGHR
ncbi:MAG: ATP-binding cassette domain-containing protein [Chlamydiia bacterium]|nr:ATP-binding cassette domain-containing protein [Chlamydiia bacterium]